MLKQIVSPQTLLRKKHQLPSFYKLNRLQFDIEKLKQETKKISDQFTDIYNSNKSFCVNNITLAESVYSHFEQISLTECKYEDHALSKEQCESLSLDPSEKNIKKRGGGVNCILIN